MAWARFATRTWLVLLLFTGACSSSRGADTSAAEADGWLELTFSAPATAEQCSKAAPTPYLFGSAQQPLMGQVDCAIHATAGETWFNGHLGASRTSGKGANLVFLIDTQGGLALTLVTDGTGTLELQPAAAIDCAPTVTSTHGNAVSADFDCPLLADPNDSTSGCGVQGTVNFEGCASE